MRRSRRLHRSAAKRRIAGRLVTVIVMLALGAALFVMLPPRFGGRTTYVVVSGHSMEPTMHLGDLAIIRKEASYRVGDVVAYRVPGHAFDAGAVVIHRIVAGDARRGFTTRGDNNNYNDPWHPRPGDMLGVRFARVPGAGVALGRLRGPLPLAGFAGIAATLAAFEALKPRRRPSPRRAFAPVSPGAM
jgi:signal peptidase I